MAIEPAYQRRGAGAELLKSGLKVADEAKAAVSVLLNVVATHIDNNRLLS
jgi:ribosomal protein S18 acetylase RimI-like enzyme